MDRKPPKCPPTVEPNQFGCVWSFSGMLDHHHHHGRPRRKLLSDESHGSKTLSGSENAKNEVRMLTFDEQLRNINIESKKEAASVSESVKRETSSSNHMRKNDEICKNNAEKPLWKRILSRYENPNKKHKDPNFVDRIVVLKPIQRVIEYPVDVGCRCSYLQPRHSSTSRQQIVKHAQVSFNDVRKKLKTGKKLKIGRKMKASEASESCEIGGNDSKLEKLLLVPISKPREPEVFVEARRHLAERLRKIATGDVEASTSSGKQPSRTLERILLSSPIHESMATFGHDQEGTRFEKSIQTRREKMWSRSSMLKQNKNSSDSGFSEIMDANDFLRGDSKLINMDSEPNNFCATGGDRFVEESRLKFSSDVSSPKVDCKSGSIDHEQFRENPSPVSVLDLFFADNIGSPTSTVESVELHLQPRRLDFEEHSSQTSSPPHHNTRLSSSMEDQGFICSYITTIYQTSESNWEEFLATDYPSEWSCDHKLLHDCIKEVLIGLHSEITFVSSKIRPFSLEKDVVNEVIEQVDWHNGLPMVPRTLDTLIRRDIEKSGRWVDVSDRNEIVFEAVDETLDVLIMEAIFDICL